MTDGILDLAPGEAVDLRVDWAGLGGGVEVLASRWSVSPPGPRLERPRIQGALASVHLDGVEAGGLYRVVNQMTTLCGLTVERPFLVRGRA